MTPEAFARKREELYTALQVCEALELDCTATLQALIDLSADIPCGTSRGEAQQLDPDNARRSRGEQRKGKAPVDTLDLDRLTALERAQLLHDATLRRHGEMLLEHAQGLALLRGVMERQERTMETLTAMAAQHAERLDLLQQILQAIKDLLERGNGH